LALAVEWDQKALVCDRRSSGTSIQLGMDFIPAILVVKLEVTTHDLVIPLHVFIPIPITRWAV
jgi:hypothetical protein